MEVTLRQLRAFIAVLEAGSFSEAAQRMHLSQPALSGLVRELEDRLGVRLLERNTRRLAPSAVGADFDPMVRRVLASLDDALTGVKNLKELRRGLVRLAAPEPLSCTLLPRLIASYGQRHPDVDVRFEDVPIEQVLAGLHHGKTDLGFGPAGVLQDESFEAHPICADPLWAALRADDPLAAKDSVTWHDLRDRVLLNYMPNLALNVLANVPARHRPRTVTQVHRVNTALSLLKVKAGWAICPSMAKTLVEGFELKFVPLKSPVVSWQVAVFARPREMLSPAVERFLQHALRKDARYHQLTL